MVFVFRRYLVQIKDMTNSLLKINVFWDVALCSVATHRPDDEGSKHL
jgi:hypothetical protein